jgi:twitching motility protein PilT
MTMDELLLEANENDASDLHLSAGEPPAIRQHGDLIRTERARLDGAEVLTLVESIMNEAQKTAFRATLECDFAVELSGVGRYRVNVFQHNRGPGAVLRSIPTTIPTMQQLGLPPVFKEICQKERGLVLVTGPTGSGKSTTLAAMVREINETWDAHILTVEDPIEFVHEPIRCMVNQREVGPHTKSFANALKSALREDPDVILVGEMRDLETISLAITAAETGHLVFGTLHTSSAPKTVDRIIDAFPGDQQAQIRAMLSESLEAVVAQTLLKRLGGGRVAAQEILIGVPAVRNLIREQKLHQIPSMMQTGKAVGMRTLDMALEELVEKKLIDKCLSPKSIQPIQPTAAVSPRWIAKGTAA